MARIGKIVGLIVVILIAVGFIIKQMTADKRITTEYEQVLVDVQANKLFTQKFKMAKPPVFPVESPFSTGKNTYPAIMCDRDKTIFAIESKPMPPDAEHGAIDAELWLPRCSICGGPVLEKPVITEGQESMDIPGPVGIIKVPREK